MEPENVHPRDFTNHRVLYNNKDFSIAIGNWDDDERQRQMCIRDRYNGIGYPSAFGHPKWFIVENNVALPLLVWLLGKSGEENDSIIKEAIKQIISQKK